MEIVLPVQNKVEIDQYNRHGLPFKLNISEKQNGWYSHCIPIVDLPKPSLRRYGEEETLAPNFISFWGKY